MWFFWLVRPAAAGGAPVSERSPSTLQDTRVAAQKQLRSSKTGEENKCIKAKQLLKLLRLFAAGRTNHFTNSKHLLVSLSRSYWDVRLLNWNKTALLCFLLCSFLDPPACTFWNKNVWLLVFIIIILNVQKAKRKTRLSPTATDNLLHGRYNNYSNSL